MDEPTSVLTPQAVEKLFTTLRTLASEGRSILYISHKLDEIRALCHRATVLRAGRVTGTCDPRKETAASLARMMIGGDLPRPRHRIAHPGEPRLVVERLSLEADDPFGTPLADVSLAVHAGEIVGLAGISGPLTPGEASPDSFLTAEEAAPPDSPTARGSGTNSASKSAMGPSTSRGLISGRTVPSPPERPGASMPGPRGKSEAPIAS